MTLRGMLVGALVAFLTDLLFSAAGFSAVIAGISLNVIMLGAITGLFVVLSMRG